MTALRSGFTTGACAAAAAKAAAIALMEHRFVTSVDIPFPDGSRSTFAVEFVQDSAETASTKAEGTKPAVVTGVSPVSAAVAGRKFILSGSARPWAVAGIDAEDIPFGPDVFDVVYICAALHQMPRREAVAAGIDRCLKPGSLLVLAAEPADWFYRVLRPLAGMLGIRSAQLDRQSVGDEANRGVGYRDIIEFAGMCCATPIAIRPKYYLTGLLYQATEAVYRMIPDQHRHWLTIRQGELEATSRFDAVIAAVPVLNRFPFFWAAVARKEGSGATHKVRPDGMAGRQCPRKKIRGKQ